MSEKSTITINTANLNEVAPLYQRYPNQTHSQPAHIEIDPVRRSASAGYSGEIGNAVSEAVWHGRIIRIGVDPAVQGPALVDFLQSDDTIALMERICDGYDERWDGSNHVGRLDDDAREAVEQLESAAGGIDTVEVWDVDEWLFGSARLRDHWTAQPIAAVVAELEQCVGPGNFVDGDFEKSLIEKAKDCFARERWGQLTETHIDDLLARGAINANEADGWREWKKQQ